MCENGGGVGERHTGKNERQKEKRERERETENKIREREREREGGREREREKNMLGTYYATKWTRLLTLLGMKHHT